MVNSPKKRLGRGLSALIGDAEPALTAASPASSPAGDNAGVVAAGAGSSQTTSQKTLPTAFISANKDQPRTRFDEAALDELAASVKRDGVLQPILVRPTGPDAYEIVAGERRWRAAQRAGLHDVPVIIKEMDDATVLQLAIIENVQRQDLTPVEEARGYKRLIDEFSHTQDDVASFVGKSRSHIANLLRLLTLPEAVQALVDDGKISMGHARALVGVEGAVVIARRIIDEGLSVRAVEALVAEGKAGGISGAGARSPAALPPGGKDANTREIERSLSAALGMKIAIDHKGAGGRLTVNYTDLDQLDGVIALLQKEL